MELSNSAAASCSPLYRLRVGAPILMLPVRHAHSVEIALCSQPLPESPFSLEP